MKLKEFDFFKRNIYTQKHMNRQTQLKFSRMYNPNCFAFPLSGLNFN